MNKHIAFWILTLGVLTCLVLPVAIQDGMFMDGVIYSTVSHNLYQGLGSPWLLHYSETVMEPYCEQLPFFFWLEQIFFQILGGSIFTERLFSFFMCLVTAFNIRLIWKLVKPSEYREIAWWPVMLWIIIPVAFWAYANHVQEVVMGAMATASVYFQLKGLQNKRPVLNFALGGLFIFFTAFCKGFQGLFPLVTIAIYWLIYRHASFVQMLSQMAIVWMVTFGVILCLFLNETSYHTLEIFFNNRIIRTFTYEGSPTTDNHLTLMWRLFTELLPSLLVGGAIFIFQKRKGIDLSVDNKLILFFVLVGLSGSLPLIVTLEQRGFYLVTTLPFFAIAIATWVQKPVWDWFHQLEHYIFWKWLGVLLLSGGILASVFLSKETKRDKVKLSDIYKVGEFIGKNQVVSIPFELRSDYGLNAYFARLFHISLSPDTQPLRLFYFRKASQETLSGYEKIPLNLEGYQLFKKIEN